MDGVVSDWRDRVRALSSSLEEGLLDLDGLCNNVKEAAAAMNYGEWSFGRFVKKLHEPLSVFVHSL